MRSTHNFYWHVGHTGEGHYIFYYPKFIYNVTNIVISLVAQASTYYFGDLHNKWLLCSTIHIGMLGFVCTVYLRMVEGAWSQKNAKQKTVHWDSKIIMNTYMNV